MSAYGLGPGASTVPLGSGHIHRTFKVDIGPKALILQQINHKVFPAIDLLMENICKVTSYIHQRSSNSVRPVTIQVVPSLQGLTHLQDDEGNWWRAFEYIGGSHTVDVPHDTSLAYEAGKTLGGFYRALEGFEPRELHVVLPHFHELAYRLDQFQQSLKAAQTKRRKNASELICLVESKAESLLWLDQWIAHGRLPQRVVHNDPKINNVLFDENHIGICMIDLDTVMPGCMLHDFGDALRTTANPAAEDELDISRVVPSLPLFKAYTQGFLLQTQSLISQLELENLHRAPAFLTFVIALRFLTDYLNNDIYYRTQHPEHNLQRARAQFALYQGFERIEDEMRMFIANLRV